MAEYFFIRFHFRVTVAFERSKRQIGFPFPPISPDLYTICSGRLRRLSVKHGLWSGFVELFEACLLSLSHLSRGKDQEEEGSPFKKKSVPRIPQVLIITSRGPKAITGLDQKTW